ncbi:hypothetical protein NCLIV_050920 [Neospora caninum Liverpool]|uniref:Exonuclease n=1 Tax=Neospora caninum (strain Liverpool) TaxID=572307 RepID=F0VKR4_NEOCL|nr:hypothetical protein NCLIV_050920 [Neospora caninum Liverpool]CBZ54665.1 hypothetical protein NCLIV_050920 [Neospora caninum Liverpool]CEL69382.1 TPA: exonuclease [Neospora caninum Liverpool]|eukprot:XP_003884695.1 hypothetical protein NCLIV_050920 [Neospora caninum Liverpool]
MRAHKKYRARGCAPADGCPGPPSPNFLEVRDLATSSELPSKRNPGKDEKYFPSRIQRRNCPNSRDTLATETEESGSSGLSSQTATGDNPPHTDFGDSKARLPSPSRCDTLPDCAVGSKISVTKEAETGGMLRIHSTPGTLGCGGGHCGHLEERSKISGGKKNSGQNAKSKKQQRPSVIINRQNSQQRPDIDSVHQILRWLVWQKFSGGSATSNRSLENKASTKHSDATGTSGVPEKCPHWLRITQPHLIGAVVVVVLPYVDLAALRMLQVERPDRVTQLLDQVVATRREAWRKEREEQASLQKAERHAEANAKNENGGWKLSPGVSAFELSEGRKCENVVSDSVNSTHEGKGGKDDVEAQGSDMFLDRRRRSAVLPNGYSSFLQFLASPSGPKIPTRVVRVETGQHCSIVRSCFSSLTDARTFRGVDVAQATANYDLCHYLLTLDELKSNNFPIPDEISGDLPAGYASVHAELLYPPYYDGREASRYADSTGASSACSISSSFSRDARRASTGSSSSSSSSCSSQPPGVSSSVALVSVDQFFGLDCEMVLTSLGTEVGRVSVVDTNGEKLLDVFVRPKARVIDYLTRFSGLEEHHLASAEHSLEDVRLQLRQVLPPDAVLVGHSLENDLHALKLVHLRCVDTSILYPHATLGLKNSLKRLVNVFLPDRKLRREAGHDSLEDARATLNLAKLKVQRGPGFGVLSKQYEPLGLALRDVASRALRYQQMRDDLSLPNERVSAGCGSSRSGGESELSPPMRIAGSRKRAVSRAEPELCISVGNVGVAASACAGDTATSRVGGAIDCGRSSETGGPMPRGLSPPCRLCKDTDRTKTSACNSELCQPTNSEDPQLNLFLVDSLMHSCTEALRDTQVLFAKNDEAVVKTCLAALNVGRKRRLPGATSVADMEAPDDSQNPPSVSCVSKRLGLDSFGGLPASHIPQVANVSLSLTRECVATVGANAGPGSDTCIYSAELKSLSGRQELAAPRRGEAETSSEVPVDTCAHDARERRNGQHEAGEREDRDCCLQGSAERDTFFPIAVCVLRSYQRFCSTAAGMPSDHLYAFNRRAQTLLRLQQTLREGSTARRDNRTMQPVDGRGDRDTFVSREGVNTRGDGNVCTDDRASRACADVANETPAATAIRVRGQRTEERARPEGDARKTGSDGDTGGESGSHGGDEATQLDEKHGACTRGYGLIHNAQLLGSPVRQRDAMRALLELDDLLLTLLAGLCHNDLLILMSPCGNAARYLSLAALRAALSSLEGGYTKPAATKPPQVSALTDRSTSGTNPSRTCRKMRADDCEDTQVRRLPEERIDLSQELAETEHWNPAKVPAAPGSWHQIGNAFSGTNSSEACSFPDLMWTSAMERELEKARGEFQGPGGGPWAAIFIRPGAHPTVSGV